MESMDRRKFIKCSTMACASIALLSKELPAQTGKGESAGATEAAKAKGVKGGPTPEYAKKMLTTDMQGLGPDGKPTRYHLSHVVGRMRVRMFVATMPDGRQQVLPSMLEVPTDEWFDYTHLLFGAPDLSFDEAPIVKPGEPSFWTGTVRSWDTRCARCHVSGYEPRRPDAAGRGVSGRSGLPGRKSASRRGGPGARRPVPRRRDRRE